MNFKTTNTPSWRHLLVAGALLCVCSACGGGGGGGEGGGVIPDPTPDPDPNPEVTTGQVSFTPDWGSLPVAEALRFHFYPVSGAVTTQDGNGNSVNVTLESGAYRMLAYNTDGKGFTYENTDRYDAACVCLSPLPGTRSTSVLSQPDQIYVMKVPAFMVDKGNTVTQKAEVSSLTRPLSIRFLIDDGSVVAKLQGIINGFFPSVLLTTGKPDAASIASSKETNLYLDAVPTGNEALSHLLSLGITDPKGASAYACKLLLTITIRDGRSLETEVDLTDAVSDILAKNDGVLPDGAAPEIKIQLTLATSDIEDDLEFVASVAGWSLGDSLDGDIQ